MEATSYYLKGEERFGTCSSKFYSRLSGLHYWKYYRSIVDEILKFSPESIMDVGCGSGDILVHIASKNTSVRLFGVDPSPGMVKAANGKIARNGLQDRITIAQGSSRDIPFQSKFDLIVSSLSFHHWKEQASSLENLSRYLSDSGRIIIFDLDRNQYPGKLPILRRHTISESNSLNLKTDGLTKEIKPLGKSGLVSFILYSENFKKN